MKAGKPILGVCRGAQLLNVYFKGTLYQNIEGHKYGVVRKTTIVKGTYLWRLLGQSISVPHFHHQAVNKLGKGFTVVQKDTDGTIEAFCNVKRKIYAYQWHPEVSGSAGRTVLKYFVIVCQNAR